MKQRYKSKATAAFPRKNPAKPPMSVVKDNLYELDLNAELDKTFHHMFVPIEEGEPAAPPPKKTTKKKTTSTTRKTTAKK